MSKPTSQASIPTWEPRDYWIIFFCALVALVPRFILLYASNFAIESDEAIVGLMGKHIIEGKPWPIFYYGQYYMGSFEPTLVGLAFALFGISNFTLKLVPLLFSLLHVGLVYRLALRFASRNVAFVAALLTALAPASLVLWSTKSRGGFIELVVLGSWALILSLDLLKKEYWKASRFFLLGAILGFGWWVNNQIVFYVVAIGLLFATRLVWAMGIFPALLVALVMLIGFLIGGTPFWYANIAHDPQWATFHTLFSDSSVSSKGFLEQLGGLFTTALPIILGARRFWSEQDVFTGSSILAFLTYAILLIAFLLRMRRTKSEPRELLLYLVISSLLVFASSKFGWLSLAPRYLLPIYSVQFVIVSIGASIIWEKTRIGAALLVVSVLGLNLSSNYIGGVAIPGEPYVYDGDRVVKDHAPLYQWLEKEGITHIRTNYWIGYRVAFETKEKVTFTQTGRPRTVRIEEYEKTSRGGVLEGVYVLSPRESAPFVRQLQQMGYDFRRLEVGGYVIVDSIRAKSEFGLTVDLSKAKLRSSHKEELLSKLVDKKRDERWGSGTAQKPGMFIEVELEKPSTIQGIELDFGDYRHDAPRSLVVEVELQNGTWEQVADFHQTTIFFDLREGAYGDVPYEWQLYLEPRLVRRVRLVQKGDSPIFDWSMVELRLYGPKATQ